MSYESITTVPLIAGEDLRSKNYRLLTLRNFNGHARVHLTSAMDDSEEEYSTVMPIGVLLDLKLFTYPVSTEGRHVGVVLGGGKIDMITARPITAGQIVMPFAAKEENDRGLVVGVDDLRSMPSCTFGVGVALQSVDEREMVEVALRFFTSSGGRNI